MLDPNDRHHLLEILSPPPGYEVDRVVGTTFSLDLESCLAIPLAMVQFDWQDANGHLATDPLVLFEAWRRCNQKITLFCQEDRIAVPRPNQRLYAFLESVVIPVRAPRRGRFHPKIWIMRFVDSENSHTVRYRLICLSRNLTFDYSWDTALVLEGSLRRRRVQVSRNIPLVRFIRALPKFAVLPLSEANQKALALLRDEIAYTDFEIPEPFEELRFWSQGLQGASWPFLKNCERILIMSPFAEPACLGRLSASGNKKVLISRRETLEHLGTETLETFGEALYLNPDSESPNEVTGFESGAEDSEMEHSEARVVTELSGLHAKVFMAETKKRVHVYTGSANATNAAFNGNIEFLVELIGPKSRAGIDTFLGNSGDSLTFRSLLVPYDRQLTATSQDPEQEMLEHELDRVRRLVAQAIWTARVTATDEPDHFKVLLEHGEPIQSESILNLVCWPVTLPQLAAQSVLGSSGRLEITLPIESLTSFFGFALQIHCGSKTGNTRFVLNIILQGAPEERRQTMLRTMLSDFDKMHQLLALMLADDYTTRGIARSTIESHESSRAPEQAISRHYLFESLLRTLDRDPDRLEQIAQLVQEVQMAEGGAKLLPEGFLEIWEPILRAHREFRR